MISFLLSTFFFVISVIVDASALLAPVHYHGPARSQSCLASLRRLYADEINSRLRTNVQKMKGRDRNSRVLKTDELNIAYEDNYILIIDKPSGVLSVSSDESIPSLCKTVYELVGSVKPSIRMSQMLVHRLGMDTSGLICFCKTIDAVRGMNTMFRSRQVMKQYEALLCGHIKNDEGLITMPLMRDYDVPPYMRVSTREHQEAIATLDYPALVPKQFLEAPKPCMTKYEVMARQYIGANNDLPVTRVLLTSISGRTHQLNVHCAAFGHPIVADTIYGFEGEASPNGGLEEHEISNPYRASLELQNQIHQATKGQRMCIHATMMNFRHPITTTAITIRSPAPF